MPEKPPSYKGFVTRHRVQLFTVEIAEAGGRRYVAVVSRFCDSHHTLHRLNLTRPRRLVTRHVVCCRPLVTPNQRGEHDIDDELLFSNHKGYVFHDSRGIESGGIEEVKILRGFIQLKTCADRLESRVHAIWFGLLCNNDDD